MEVLDADGSIEDTKACVLVAEDLPRVRDTATSDKPPAQDTSSHICPYNMKTPLSKLGLLLLQTMACCAATAQRSQRAAEPSPAGAKHQPWWQLCHRGHRHPPKSDVHREPVKEPRALHGPPDTSRSLATQ